MRQENFDRLKQGSGFIVYLYAGDMPWVKHDDNRAINVATYEEAREAVKNTKKYIMWSNVDIYGPVSIRAGTIIPLSRGDGPDEIIC